MRGDVTNAYMFLLQARGTVLRHGTCRRWTRRLGPSPWAAGRRAKRTSAKSGYPARACHMCTTYMDEKGYAGERTFAYRRVARWTDKPRLEAAGQASPSAFMGNSKQ